MDPQIRDLPIAVIGAGPVGLAAASYLAMRGERFVVLERGATVGHSIRKWGHVRLFSPWRYCIAPSSKALLEETGWRAPDEDSLPTGHDLVDRYLRPLAEVPEIAAHLRFNAEVTSVGRKGIDKSVSAERGERPFELRFADGSRLLARAVIDTSGTWFQPNPLGADGRLAQGEAALSGDLTYGIPDLLGERAADFAGKRTLVVGSGHSAINSVLGLLELKKKAPATSVIWAMRRRRLGTVFGGGDADALPARGALGAAARIAVQSGQVELLAPLAIQRIGRTEHGFTVDGELGSSLVSLNVDQVIVATGFRPDLDMLGEVRLSLDPALESSAALGPLIDPNVHSCGTVPPHGARELAHAEPDFFVIGSKSYGRAPTFLLATGYEQARSVVAYLTGDYEAAARVELVLPETGVCGTGEDDGACCDTSPPPPARYAAEDLLFLTGEAGSCCGGPAPAGADACCVLDAEAKAAGEAGCGCSTELSAITSGPEAR